MSIVAYVQARVQRNFFILVEIYNLFTFRSVRQDAAKPPIYFPGQGWYHHVRKLSNIPPAGPLLRKSVAALFYGANSFARSHPAGGLPREDLNTGTQIRIGDFLLCHVQKNLSPCGTFETHTAGASRWMLRLQKTDEYFILRR